MSTRVPAAFFCVLLAGSVTAQSYFIPDNSSTVGGCNVIPFGQRTRNATWSNQKYQQIVQVSELGGTTKVGVICDLAFVPCTFGVRHFDTIEITLAQTKAASLSTTFATNMVTNVQTVLKATNYEWHNATANTWSRIGLDKSYLYLASNGNLVVQIQVTGASLKTTSTVFPGYRTGARQRVYAYGWTTTPPAIGRTSRSSAQKIEVLFGMNDAHAFGVGCTGSNGKAPALSFTGSAKLGASLSMNLSDALPTTPVLHVVSLTRYEPAIDLALIGASGCLLYESVDLLIGGVTDAGGRFSRSVTIPNDPKIICARVYTQFFPVDATANRWGSTASNYGRILPGN